MRLPAWCLAGAVSLTLAANVATAAHPPRTATPLLRAHSHNDYEHPRPLLDALDHGFVSVEADIYLVDGQLLVAHDRPQVKPERTLQALYLDPLRARVKTHGGRVYPGGPTFWLLVDIKADAEGTYRRLEQVLADYRDMLTVFRPDRTETKAVTIVLSGDRPWNQVRNQPERWVGIDGRLADLDAQPAPGPHLVPWISDNWRSHFRWNGEGDIPAEERARLIALVAKAHGLGYRLRFWGAADREPMWRLHHEVGVDLINTDRLADLEKFLRAAPSVRPGTP